ncbi:MAG TPA: metal-dependent phosphohydrolase [Nocardioidaceae bacterium]|nr:metal-dependent phosphohydrolase [Nocardioidaceae bacterium]
MDEIRSSLRERYAEPHRRYHDVRHLDEVLAAVDLLAAEAGNLDAVTWAVWLHDAVYEVGSADNEEQSALLAEQLLPEPFAHEVARLVRLTATHKPAPGDVDGAVLCDADLHILAADERRYAEYAADVRAEYAAVDDTDFATGRAALLAALLTGPIFHTPTGRRLWEQRARDNVSAEIRRLRDQP